MNLAVTHHDLASVNKLSGFQKLPYNAHRLPSMPHIPTTAPDTCISPIISRSQLPRSLYVILKKHTSASPKHAQRGVRTYSSCKCGQRRSTPAELYKSTLMTGRIRYLYPGIRADNAFGVCSMQYIDSSMHMLSYM